MRALPTVYPPAHHPLGVLNRNTPLGSFTEDDQANHTEHHQDNKGYEEDLDLPGLDQLDRVDNRRRPAGHDTGKDNQRDAVADPTLGHLFTEPHQKRRSRGERDHGHQFELHTGVQDDHLPAWPGHALEPDGNKRALDDTEHYRTISGVLGYFTASGLTLFLE